MKQQVSTSLDLSGADRDAYCNGVPDEERRVALKDRGLRLFESRRYAKAWPMLWSAVKAFPKDEGLWEKLILAASWNEQHEQAVKFTKQAIRHYPRLDWLWQRLGSELTAIERLDEAERALRYAQSLNPQAEQLWRHYAALHQQRKHFEQEIEAWEYLCTLGGATAADLNSLGIAYYHHKNFAKALELHRRSAATEPNAAALFHMGRVYADPDVSQEIDAVDAYRRAVAIDPQHEGARDHLEAIKRHLGPLARRVKSEAADLIQPDEGFQFYINPFEALQLEKIEDCEIKSLQRARKKLLQEIDLNDGKVSWLNDYPLDPSRALALEDELQEAAKRNYHWMIFRTKPLRRFLTHGALDHFLFSEDYFPRETLDWLDAEPAFRRFLSTPFAQQYNFLLTRALDRRRLAVVEALFDGRRWVTPEEEDGCFKGANLHLSELLEALRALVKEGRQRTILLAEMEEFLHRNALPALANLLPLPFAFVQRDLVAEIRSLAISCANDHHDRSLSLSLIGICKQFTIRSIELTQRLEDDEAILQSWR